MWLAFQLLVHCGSGREQLWKYGCGFCAVLTVFGRDAHEFLFEMVLGKVALIKSMLVLQLVSKNVSVFFVELG